MAIPKPATQDLLRRVIELACRAPSVHNTQPWHWRIVGADTIELYADHSRQLKVADPDGRNLVISCGAALHHAIEAGLTMGLSAKPVICPDPENYDLLARITFTRTRPPADAQTRLLTLQQRRTDRRRFTSWPVPDARLHKLAESASGWGAYAIPITDVTARFRAELLMGRAMLIQARDPRFADEQTAWIEHSQLDGVPSETATPTKSRRENERPNRFALETGPERPTGSTRVVESSDGLMAICTARDDVTSWLLAGQALSALWLHATRDGLSIVPLSQVIEVPETHQALRKDVFADMAQPQLLVRVGWQEIARATLPHTPRRPLDDVLLR